MRFSRVLVTGGAGFLGSHLVDRLMQMEMFVRVVDNLSSGSLENVKGWLGDSRFEFVHGDLKDLVECYQLAYDVLTLFDH